MPLTQAIAERIEEQLYVLNPNLSVRVKPVDNAVVATIPKWEMDGEQLKTLAEIAHGSKVTFDRTGGKLRMVIN